MRKFVHVLLAASLLLLSATSMVWARPYTGEAGSVVAPPDPPHACGLSNEDIQGLSGLEWRVLQTAFGGVTYLGGGMVDTPLGRLQLGVLYTLEGDPFRPTLGLAIGTVGLNVIPRHSWGIGLKAQTVVRANSADPHVFNPILRSVRGRWWVAGSSLEHCFEHSGRIVSYESPLEDDSGGVYVVTMVRGLGDYFVLQANGRMKYVTNADLFGAAVKRIPVSLHQATPSAEGWMIQ